MILRRHGELVTTTTQLHSTKIELAFCAGSNSAHGVEITNFEKKYYQLWHRGVVVITTQRYSTKLNSESNPTRGVSTVHKKWSCSLRISSVNVTNSAVSCGFGHIYWRNPQWKTYFLCSAKVCNGENLQWSRLEISLITFRWSTIPQKKSSSD